MATPNATTAGNETTLGHVAAAYLTITSNLVSDSQLTTSLWLNTLLGALCFLAFCVLQRSVFPRHYRYRLVSQSVTVKPKFLPTKGWSSLWAWLIQALTATDEEILRSSGLDAMVMIKALSMGVQIFLPLAVIGCGVLLPLHYTQRVVEDSGSVNRSQLMQLTIAALPRGSNLMWLHFVLIVAYNAWIMYVLAMKYKEFTMVRLHYLIKGDDPNYWMALTQQAETEFLARKVRKMLTEVNRTVSQPSQGGPPPDLDTKGPSPPPNTMRESVMSLTASRVGQWWKAVTAKNLNPGGTATTRNSLDSCKQYNVASDSLTPGASPPLMSPDASLAGLGPAGWGKARSAVGSSGSEGQGEQGLGSESSRGEVGGPASGGPAVAAPAAASAVLPSTAAGVAGPDGGGLAAAVAGAGAVMAAGAAGFAAAAAAATNSRRWSGSSGSGSESATAGGAGSGGGVAGMARTVMDGVGRLGRAGKAASKSGRAAGGGVPPTHQTISELHSITSQASTPFQDLSVSGWGSVPKHMRTITEDSLEYRLAETQNSRPNSRGGLSGATQRGSSTGSADIGGPSPSRAQASAALAAAAAAAAADGGMVLGGAALPPSPLSRASSAQQAPLQAMAGSSGGGISGAATHRSSGHGGLASEISARGSIDSCGLDSVCTRITHGSAGSDSGSPEQDSRRSSVFSDGGDDERPGSHWKRSSAAADSEASFASGGGSTAGRDISFGGAAMESGRSPLQLSPELADEFCASAASSDGQSGRRGASAGLAAVSEADITLEGVDGSADGADGPVAAASQPQHSHQSSVDFSRAGLAPLSRASTPLSPEDGGQASPRPMGGRGQRGPSSSGRWSPFASSDRIAAGIAADGVAGSRGWAGAVGGASPASSGAVQQQGSTGGPGAPQMAAGSTSTSSSSSSAPQGSAAGPGGSSSQHQQQHPQQQQGFSRSEGGAAAAAGGGSRSAVAKSTSMKESALLHALHNDASFRSQATSDPGIIRTNSKPSRPRVEAPFASSTASSAANSADHSPSAAQAQQYASQWQSQWHWQQQGWQPQPQQPLGPRPHGSSSNNGGQSRIVSPLASSHPTPRESGAVAGAAVGAGMVLPVAGVASAASTAGGLGAVAVDAAAEKLQVLFDPDGAALLDDDGGTAGLPAADPRRVAYHWWKELPADQLRVDDDAGEEERPDDWCNYDKPLLAKPSVRFRKTINVRNTKKDVMQAANAQHYCVLVTDVQQWPYPELQQEAQAKQKPHPVLRAWSLLASAASLVPAILSWGVKGDDQRQHLEQQQLLPLQQQGYGLSDMHPPVIPPAPAGTPALGAGFVPAAAAAGPPPAGGPPGSGGGSAVGIAVGRGISSRGQMSSCATSADGLGLAGQAGGSAVMMANPLARLSHVSGMSHFTHLPESLDECESFLAHAERQLEQAWQKVQLDSNLTAVERDHKLHKLEKARSDLRKWAAAQEKEQERRQLLAREHSLMHLDPVSRSTSYLRLGQAGGFAGPVGLGPAGGVSRASSYKSSKARGEQADVRQLLGGPSRALTPSSLQASAEGLGGLYAAEAGGPGRERIDPLLLQHALREKQQHRQPGQQRSQRVRVGSVRSPQGALMAEGGSGAAAVTSSAGGAASAGGIGASHQLAGHSSEPAGFSQQLADVARADSMPASVALMSAVHPGTAAESGATATRMGSSNSHALLLGEMSMDQPSGSNSSPAATAAAAAAAAAPNFADTPLISLDSINSPVAAAAGEAAGGALGQPGPGSASEAGAAVAALVPAQHAHRRYVLRQQQHSAEGGRRSPLQLPGSPTAAEDAFAAVSVSRDGSPSRGGQQLWVNTQADAAEAGLQESDGGTAAAAAAGSGAAFVPIPARPPSVGAAVANVASDSFDSNASSYAARRSVVTFKPCPPDSPRSAQQQQHLQQQQQAAEGGRRSPSPFAGPASSRSLSASRPAQRQDALLHSETSASRLGLQSQSVTVQGPYGGSWGSSGGGAGGPWAAQQAISLAMVGRSRSARYSSSSSQPDSLQQGGVGGHSGSNPSFQPDHLALLIPPAQHGPLSRGSTPMGNGTSGGGHPGSTGFAVGGPTQPWGLPADAALLSSSLSLVNSTIGSPGGAGRQHGVGEGLRGRTRRWSLVSGGAAGGPPSAEVSTHNLGSSLAHSPTPAEPHDPRSAAAAAAAASLMASKGSLEGSSDMASEAAASIVLRSDKQQRSQLEVFRLVSEADQGGEQLHLQAQRHYWEAASLSTACEPTLQQLIDAFPQRLRGWRRLKFAWTWRNNRPDLGWNCRSVLLRLPEQEGSYSIVTSTFQRLFPHDFDRAIPVYNHKKVDMLLMQWEATVGALERAELKKARTGREPRRLDARCGGLLTCCADSCGCAACDWRGTCLGRCCGEELMVPIIPELRERIFKLEDEIETARRAAFDSAFTPSWFVLFKSQQAAAIAASTRIYAEDSVQFQVHPAPGPEEVNWQHLWMSWQERDCRTILTWPFILAIVLFPITLISSAASRLDYVFCPEIATNQPRLVKPAYYWDWYCENKAVGGTLPSFLRAFITGWLPSLLLNLWLVMLLPRLVYLLVQSEGSCFSLSALERRIGAVFFYWDIFNVFLQGTIGSTFFMQVRKIIQSPDQLPNILGAALPDASNFFMQFIAMRSLFLIWLRMCVPHGGVWQNWCHYCWCPSCCCSTCNTDRDKSLTYGPRTPRYGFEMGHMLLMYLIAIAFSIVSPLLLPFSVVWFAFAWVAWRHNLSYVYQRKYESGGLMWIFLFSRIVMCLVIGQLFTFCVLVVRGAYWQAFLIIAFMPALTARYYKYCQARYARGVEYGVPLDTAQKNDAERVARVPAHVYIPPPLQNRSWGWYPEWNKMWDGWGMPAYSV